MQILPHKIHNKNTTILTKPDHTVFFRNTVGQLLSINRLHLGREWLVDIELLWVNDCTAVALLKDVLQKTT